MVRGQWTPTSEVCWTSFDADASRYGVKRSRLLSRAINPRFVHKHRLLRTPEVLFATCRTVNARLDEEGPVMGARGSMPCYWQDHFDRHRDGSPTFLKQLPR